MAKLILMESLMKWDIGFLELEDLINIEVGDLMTWEDIQGNLVDGIIKNVNHMKKEITVEQHPKKIPFLIKYNGRDWDIVKIDKRRKQ